MQNLIMKETKHIIFLLDYYSDCSFVVAYSKSKKREKEILRALEEET